MFKHFCQKRRIFLPSFLIHAICAEWFARYHCPMIFIIYYPYKMFQMELKVSTYTLGNILTRSNIRWINHSEKSVLRRIIIFDGNCYSSSSIALIFYQKLIFFHNPIATYDLPNIIDDFHCCSSKKCFKWSWIFYLIKYIEVISTFFKRLSIALIFNLCGRNFFESSSVHNMHRYSPDIINQQFSSALLSVYYQKKKNVSNVIEQTVFTYS